MAEDNFAMGYALGQDSNGGSGGFGGMWGEGLWAIIILAMLGFGGGRGFGGFGGGGGMYDGFAVNNIDSGIRSLANGLCDSTYALNNTMTNGFFNLSSQLASCCCDTREAIGQVRFDMANNTRDIIDATNCGTRAILDYLCQDKITSLTAENQALKFQASQTAQNQFITQVGSDIVNRLQPVPVPAYQVANPYAGYGYGYGYGRDGGCGCGCGF